MKKEISDMTNKLTWCFNNETIKCNVCDENSDLRLAIFHTIKGEDFVICKQCLYSTTLLLMTNEGV